MKIFVQWWVLILLALLASLSEAVEVPHAPSAEVLQSVSQTFNSIMVNYRDSLYTGSMKFGTD